MGIDTVHLQLTDYEIADDARLLVQPVPLNFNYVSVRHSPRIPLFPLVEVFSGGTHFQLKGRRIVTYQEFIKRKSINIIAHGFNLNGEQLSSRLFEFQEYIVKKAPLIWDVEPFYYEGTRWQGELPVGVRNRRTLIWSE